MSIFGVCELQLYNLGEIQYLGPENYGLRKCTAFALRNESKAAKNKAQSFYAINTILRRLSQMLRHSTKFYDCDSPI